MDDVNLGVVLCVVLCCVVCCVVLCCVACWVRRRPPPPSVRPSRPSVAVVRQIYLMKYKIKIQIMNGMRIIKL